MRMLILQGRVVADAQVKSTTKGTAYVTFRFANNEFNDKEDSTFWLNARSFDPSIINLAKFITKGKPLTLVGNYSNKVYAAKDGTCQVDNDLVLTAVHFSESGKRDGETTSYEQTKPAEEIKVTGVSAQKATATTKSKKKTEPVKEVETPKVSDEDDDDLPF